MKFVGTNRPWRAFFDGTLPFAVLAGLVAILIALTGSAMAEGQKGVVPKVGPAERYNKQAGQLCEQGEFEKGLALFELSLKIAPQNGLTYYGRSICRLNNGDYDGALADCNKGIQLDRQKLKGGYRAFVFNIRAMIYLKKKSYSKGMKDANRALSMTKDPASRSDIYDTRGHLHLGLKELWQALADFDRGLKINPKLIPSYWGRGQVYERLGMLEKALADYRTAIALDTKGMSENKEAQENARARLDRLTRTGPSCKRDECADL